MVSKRSDAPAKKSERLLYVEGGGDHNPSLASECRRAFQKMFEKANINLKPRVVACGGRKQAYDQFCSELATGNNQAWLLVDAEELAPALKPGNSADPWSHVKTRQGDQWDRPSGARDEQLHLMSVNMETWLLNDRDALCNRFGSKLNLAKLPPDDSSLETKTKETVYKALDDAVKQTPSKGYSKGSHSFKILAEVDPMKLRLTLFWADRFLLEMGAPPLPEGSASRAPDPAPLP